MAKARQPRKPRKRDIENYAHADKERVNNPPVGLVTPDTDNDAPRKTYQHDPHIDPQLSWAGKAEHKSFEVPTVSLHVHERIDPRTIIEAVRKRNGAPAQLSLGVADMVASTGEVSERLEEHAWKVCMGESPTGKGNLFVVFGEPDIAIEEAGDQLRVRVRGVDVYHPASGDITSDNADGIACWFVDTDYNGESFFVRHAYFLGAGASDPYKSLKTTLKAEIDADAWNTLYSDVSRPFEKPTSGRIAVKVINHLGDEVMKVLHV